MAGTRQRRSVIYRREFKQLRGLIQRSQELFHGRGKFNGADLYWRELPGDRVIEFGAVQYEGDARNYQGRAHDFIGFDELTHFLEPQFWFLLGWLRTTTPGQRCRVGATFNPPTNAAERWVVGLFAPWLDRKHHRPAMPGELRWYARIDGKDVERDGPEPFEHEGDVITPLSRTFFPARLADNPLLAATNYGTQLQSLPEPLRSQLAYGDFDAAVEDDPWQVIPTAWVEAAMARWRAQGGDSYRPPVRQTCIGMDVAHGGKDRTVLAPRYGDWFARLARYEGRDTPDGRTAAALAVRAFEPGSFINVDAIGYGASAAERLADRPPEGHGLHAVPVNVATRSDHTDRSGKYKMVNTRAEMYWRLREALDPEFDSAMALPDDPELLADLTSAVYEIVPGGIKIESKDQIAARLGRSPDAGDAVALAMIPLHRKTGPIIAGPPPRAVTSYRVR
jgi:hypothetical protein